MRSLVVLPGRFLAVAVLFIFAGFSLRAQTSNGAIAGSILDSSGGVVPDAQITATGVESHSVYNTVSSSTGAYRLSGLVLGTYNVTVTAKGFKVSELAGVVVQIDTTASLDITMQPGNVKETLTVLADAPRIQTETSEIGTVVSNRQIEELPLGLNASSQSFLRSPETFVFLTPGTQGPGTNQNGAAANGIFQSKLSGGQNFGTEVLLDGVSTTRADSGSAFDQTAPSVEALTEFKVLTSTFSSAYGRSSGGVESFSTKSGGNAYHGTGFDLLHNDKLNANSWGNDFNHSPKPRDHQNDFGGSLGGPVWIPKVYNGHDKTFFFFSYEQYRNNQGTNSGLITLPTQQELQGDFSAGLGGPTGATNPCDNNSPILQGQIFDPSTTTTVIVNGKPVTCRKPFPGNKIDTPLDPVALNVLKFLTVTPNQAPTAQNRNGLINNFIYISNQPIRDTTMSFRIDQNWGANDKFFFSYSSRDQEDLNGLPGAPDLPVPLDSNFFNSNFTHYVRFGWDHTINATLVNNLTIGLNRLSNFSRGTSVNGTPDWEAVLGIKGAHGPTFPQFSFNNSSQGIGYQGFSSGSNDRHVPNSLPVSENLSWVTGRHSFQFGLEWRAYQYSDLPTGNTSPAYTFNNYQTAYTQNDTSTGDPFASFLLGLPQKEFLSVSSSFPRWNSNYFAAYVQDDFKLRRDLTLNLGLRYDFDTTRNDAKGTQSNTSLTTPNPGAGGLPGALVYGPFASLGKTYFKDFGPRVGFAYAPTELFGRIHNIVFRGGYAIYYSPILYDDLPTGNIQFRAGSTSQPQFGSFNNFDIGNALPLSAGFPSYPAPVPSTDPSLLNGQNVTYIASSYGRPGRTQNWTFEIQKQLAQDLILSVGYVGVSADHLHTNIAQVNALNPKYYSLGNALSFHVTDAAAQPILANLGVSVPSWFEPLYGSSGGDTIAQLLRPFPQYLAVGGSNNNLCSCLENLGVSTYNSFQAKLERRFRNGLNLLASYTFSKTITNADSAIPVFSGFSSNEFAAQNPFNPSSQKALSYQDTPHALVLSYLYELPAGPGKAHFNQGVASRVLGGWEVGGVQRYQSGTPSVSGFFGASPPGTDGGWRLSLLPGVPILDPNHGSYNHALPSACQEDQTTGLFAPASTNNFFNCAAFFDPNASTLVTKRGYVYGNIPLILGNVRSQPYFSEDFSIIKRTVISENHAIIFKVDIPNAFNRHVFGTIGVNPSFNSNFGQPKGFPNTVNSVRVIQLTLRYQF
jgi:Carboxypeptidase regulatory-like domain